MNSYACPSALRPPPRTVKENVSQLLQRLHRVRYSETRFGHYLPAFLGHLRQRLRLAQLVRMFAQLA